MYGITLALIAWALFLPCLLPSWAYAHRGLRTGRIGPAARGDGRARRGVLLGRDALARVEEERPLGA